MGKVIPLQHTITITTTTSLIKALFHRLFMLYVRMIILTNLRTTNIRISLFLLYLSML